MDAFRREEFKREMRLLCVQMDTYVTNCQRGSMTPLSLEKLKIAWN